VIKILDHSKLIKIKERVTNFLEKYGIFFQDIDLQKQVDLFLDEMVKGLEEKGSSLKMFPTFIQFCNKITANKPVMVLDAGGTNFRSALITFNDNDEPVIRNFKQSLMPGSKNEVSKDEFFRIIIENIKDVIDKSDNIGFVFSYPTEIYPNQDGRLTKFSKEIKAKEVEGELIGENLKAAIRKSGFKAEKKVVILNDTVASLLSGISAFRKRTFESFIGFILGTGSNACYIEKNANIKNKFSSQFEKNDYQIINIESGNFSKGQRGEIDLSFDNKTINPGMFSYEKMFSGAYLGGIATEAVKFASEDGLFSDVFSKKINDSIALESRDIDDFLYFPPEDAKLLDLIKNATETDLVSLYHIFDNLVERASIFTSVVLTSAIIKSGKGHNPCNPVCIIAEGSSYYRLKNFQTRVESYMRKVLSRRGDYYFEIHKVDNAILLGAAVAGLNS